MATRARRRPVVTKAVVKAATKAGYGPRPARPKRGGLGGPYHPPDKGTPSDPTGQGVPRKPKQGSASAPIPPKPSKPPKVGDNRPKPGTEAYRKMVKAKNKAAGRRSY